MACVYKMTFPDNKIYIGKADNVKNRWCAKESAYRSYTFINDVWRKFKWDDVKREILIDNLTADEARQLESFCILIYKSKDKEIGYNETGCYWDNLFDSLEDVNFISKIKGTEVEIVYAKWLFSKWGCLINVEK